MRTCLLRSLIQLFAVYNLLFTAALVLAEDEEADASESPADEASSEAAPKTTIPPTVATAKKDSKGTAKKSSKVEATVKTATKKPTAAATEAAEKEENAEEGGESKSSSAAATTKAAAKTKKSATTVAETSEENATEEKDSDGEESEKSDDKSEEKGENAEEGATGEEEADENTEKSKPTESNVAENKPPPQYVYEKAKDCSKPKCNNVTCKKDPRMFNKAGELVVLPTIGQIFTKCKTHYMVSKSETQANQADSLCCMMGMRLLSVETIEESKCLQEIARDNFKNDFRRRSFWTSGTDNKCEGHFAWCPSLMPIYEGMQWAPGEPNNGRRQEHFIELRLTDTEFNYNDKKIYDSLRYICEAKESELKIEKIVATVAPACVKPPCMNLNYSCPVKRSDHFSPDGKKLLDSPVSAVLLEACGKKYVVGKKLSSIFDAMKNCCKYAMRLVTLESIEEFFCLDRAYRAALKTELKFHSGGTNLNCPSVWWWCATNTRIPKDLPWLPNQPDGLLREAYIGLHMGIGKSPSGIFDNTGMIVLNFLCENEEKFVKDPTLSIPATAPPKIAAPAATPAAAKGKTTKSEEDDGEEDEGEAEDEEESEDEEPKKPKPKSKKESEKEAKKEEQKVTSQATDPPCKKSKCPTTKAAATKEKGEAQKGVASTQQIKKSSTASPTQGAVAVATCTAPCPTLKCDIDSTLVYKNGTVKAAKSDKGVLLPACSGVYFIGLQLKTQKAAAEFCCSLGFGLLWYATLQEQKCLMEILRTTVKKGNISMWTSASDEGCKGQYAWCAGAEREQLPENLPWLADHPEPSTCVVQYVQVKPGTAGDSLGSGVCTQQLAFVCKQKFQMSIATTSVPTTSLPTTTIQVSSKQPNSKSNRTANETSKEEKTAKPVAATATPEAPSTSACTPNCPSVKCSAESADKIKKNKSIKTLCDKKYFIATKKMKFSDAATECCKQNMELLILENRQEQDCIYKELKSSASLFWTNGVSCGVSESVWCNVARKPITKDGYLWAKNTLNNSTDSCVFLSVGKQSMELSYQSCDVLSSYICRE